MAINLEEAVKQFTDLLRTEANTQTVVGQSFQLGEFTCVPVIKFGMGLGYGGGEGHGDAAGKGKGEGTGGAAAGGMGVEPLGFLSTRGDQISFIPARTNKGLSAVFEKVPDMMEKMFDKNKAAKAEAAV